MSSLLYHFSGEHLRAMDWCDPSQGETLVADSWRVEDGQAVNLAAHLARFTQSVRSTTEISDDHMNAFFTRVIDMIPATGLWFPRIEAVATPGGATLRYRHRVAPAWSDEVILARAPYDPRTTPTVKGPDLEAMLALRQSVAPQGAAEALIVDADDTIIEGAYSTVMVWRAGSDTLTVVPKETPRIPSVTESVLSEIARSRGVDVVSHKLTVSDCEGSDIWILSALHGIRLATGFIDGPQLRSDKARRDLWQAAWWATREPNARITSTRQPIDSPEYE